MNKYMLLLFKRDMGYVNISDDNLVIGISENDLISKTFKEVIEESINDGFIEILKKTYEFDEMVNENGHEVEKYIETVWYGPTKIGRAYIEMKLFL